MAINYNEENSGHSDSFEVGSRFQDFVCIKLAEDNVILQNINSKKFQYETGENLQGFEIKYDSNVSSCLGSLEANEKANDGPAIFTKRSGTCRLSIEIAEKTKAENEHFVPSGIYRGDNSWLYIQGNYHQFWVFSVKMLRLLHKSNRYEESTKPTVKSFYLPIADADRFCAKKIIINYE